LGIVYPGKQIFPMDEKITAYGLESIIDGSFNTAIKKLRIFSEVWRRWESNPCPQYQKPKALHVYSLIIRVRYSKDRAISYKSVG